MADPAPLTQNIRLYQGSTLVYRVRYEPDGEPADLSGWVGDLDIALDYATPAVVHLDQDDGLSFGSDGWITATFRPEHTSHLEYFELNNDHVYDLYAGPPSGERIAMAQGTCTIVAAVRDAAA